MFQQYIPDKNKLDDDYQRTSLSSRYTVENIINDLKEIISQQKCVFTEDKVTGLTRCEVNLDNIHIPENANEFEGNFYTRLKKELKKLGICRVFRFWGANNTLQIVLYVTPKGKWGWLKHLVSSSSMESFNHAFSCNYYHRFPETYVRFPATD